jgi:hypothetical protein
VSSENRIGNKKCSNDRFRHVASAIESHFVAGNLRTVTRSKNGSIDWFCFSRSIPKVFSRAFWRTGIETTLRCEITLLKQMREF